MSGEGLPERWLRLSDESSDYFSKEFYREADRSHPLFDERMWAVAKSQASDDVLYEIHDGRFAQIHLTFAVETTPQFPGFEVFESLEAWRKRLEEDANWQEGDK